MESLLSKFGLQILELNISNYLELNSSKSIKMTNETIYGIRINNINEINLQLITSIYK